MRSKVQVGIAPLDLSERSLGRHLVLTIDCSSLVVMMMEPRVVAYSDW